MYTLTILGPVAKVYIFGVREAFRKKLDILWQPANFNSHLPILPIYDIKIYDKAVIIIGKGSKKK